jgi:hypothetical protein
MGMLARSEHQARYRAMVAEDGFGKDESMRCHYYDPPSGGCGIWRFREAQCSTWFCRHEHGQAGRELWAVVLDMLVGVEATLTLWCLREHGLAVASADRDDPHAWAHWWGREAEFYTDCAAAVNALDADELLRLLPESTLARRDAVIRAHAALTAPALVPLRLQ